MSHETCSHVLSITITAMLFDAMLFGRLPFLFLCCPPRRIVVFKESTTAAQRATHMTKMKARQSEDDKFLAEYNFDDFHGCVFACTDPARPRSKLRGGRCSTGQARECMKGAMSKTCAQLSLWQTSICKRRLDLGFCFFVGGHGEMRLRLVGWLMNRFPDCLTALWLHG